MLDDAADACDRRRNHVAPVGNRGRTEYDHELRAETKQFLDRGRQRRLIMRHAALGDDGGAGGSQPLRCHPQGLFHHLRRQPRQQGRDDADALDDIGRDPQRAAGCRGHRGVAQPAFDPERNKLDGCDHLAFDHRLVGGKGCEGDGFIDAVDAVNLRAIHHQHAGLGREQVGAPGKGALDMDALAGNGLRDARRRDVFRDVTLFEPHHDDFLDPGAGERLDLGRADRGAFLQHQRSLAERVNGDAADRLHRTGRTELHAASSFSFGNRSCAVISAMIATAISDGDTAPIGRPIGA